MKTKFSPILSTFKSALVASSLIASIATAAVTAPVGYVKLTFNKEADTPFSIPMNRAKVFSGKIDSHSGNSITINSNAFTASQFVYNDGSQNDHFYILFTSGTLEGRSFDIESNTLNSVTVTQASVDSTNTNDLAALINNASSTDSFEIRPHWTLNTLFPNGEGVPKTTSFSNVQAAIQFRPVPTMADPLNQINVPINNQYVYFDSPNDAADGWYIPGQHTTLGKQNNVVLDNKTFYILRNNSQQTHEANITGDVPTVKFANSMRSHVVAIDNYKAISFPVELSLAESMLVESGVFKKTTSFSLKDGDTLQTFTYPSPGFNQPFTTEYVYFDSSNDSADGWYIPGQHTTLGKQDAEKIFKPGQVFIIRTTTAGRTEGEKLFWVTPLPYNPFQETPAP